MNRIVSLLVVLVAGCSAQYIVNPWALHSPISPLITPYLAAPSVVSSVVSPIAVSTSSQYHAQDELGQFAFGHSSDSQAREEVKSADGTVRGAYSYVDPKGKLINVQYLADSNGFRVLGANNLPVAPTITLEPVKDTPEVVAARAAFAVKFEEAKVAAAKDPEQKVSRRRRDILLSSLIPAVAKTTLKTQELAPVDGALTPANTKLTEIKEKEHEILTPYSIHVPALYSSPLITHNIINPSVVIKSIDVKPVEVKTVEKTVPTVITSPLITSRLLTPSLIVGKTTVKTSELKPVEDAKTPAATKLADVKETEREIFSPLSWSAPTLIHTPIVRSGLVTLW